MKKEEKQILFNLLKTADSYVNGYQRDCFNVEVDFQDDENDNEEIVQEVKTEDSSETKVTKLSETLKTENSATSGENQPEVTKFSETSPSEKIASSTENHPETAKLSETSNSQQTVSGEKLQEISENLKNVENAAQNMFANADKAASDAATEVEELKNKDFSPILSSKSTEEKQPEHSWPVYEGNVLGQAPDITANIPDEKIVESRISFAVEPTSCNTESLAELAMKTQQNVQAGTDNIQKKNEDVSEETQERVSLENASSQKSGITLDQLNQKILRCTRCGLARTRNNVVPGEGVLNPDVLVVGEGPGYDEDMQGHPFVGKAGMLLDKMLHAIYLDRHTNCFIGNIVKCRPPQNRNPFPDEQDACFPFLEAQIHILKPKMILCLGKVAIEKIMNQKISINASHGQFFDYNGIPVMATYHPSALLRNQELKRPAWEDLKGFARKLDEIKRKK